jgi:hypothetical protein
MTLFVVENVEESSQRKLFTFMGVDYLATPRSFLNLPLMALLGIVIAFLFAPVDELLEQVLIGIGYGLLIIVVVQFHDLGHIIGARMVGAPMKSLLMTATVNLTIYEDDSERPSRVHLGRALGGPVFNLLLGLIVIVIYRSGADNHFILFFGIVNLALVAITLLPIPSVDGSVILRELRNRKQ